MVCLVCGRTSASVRVIADNLLPVSLAVQMCIEPVQATSPSQSSDEATSLAPGQRSGHFRFADPRVSLKKNMHVPMAERGEQEPIWFEDGTQY